MVIAPEHLLLQVVANLVYEVNLEERLAPDEVPHHALLLELALVVEDIVNGLLCHLPGHPLLRVLPHEVAILASQLAVLRDNERDGLCHTVLPTSIILFDSIIPFYHCFYMWNSNRTSMCLHNKNRSCKHNLHTMWYWCTNY